MSKQSHPSVPDCFTCHRCGNCCKGEGDVFISTPEAERIARYLHISVFDFHDTYTYKSGNRRILTAQKNQDCIFLEGDGCRIHSVKPDQCASWPYWPELLESSHGFEYGKSYCEGLKPFTHEQFKSIKGKFAPED